MSIFYVFDFSCVDHLTINNNFVIKFHKLSYKRSKIHPKGTMFSEVSRHILFRNNETINRGYKECKANMK